MANSNNWGEIYNSTWWGDKAWSANTLFIDSAPPGFGLNLLKASEDLDNTIDWDRLPDTTDVPTVSANTITDPNGGTTAERVDFTANRQARLQQRVTLEASKEYTFSIYAKVNTGTQNFRLRNVTLGDAESKTATTSWTRFSYTFTTTTAGDYDLSLQNNDNTARTLEFWGAMLNEGATAGDYVKTEASVSGSAPAPAYSGFGDAFGGVTAYYSLRQFTEAETLNAIRVRRSSDDTEQDIGFDANGDLDTTALTTFVNADVNQYTSDFSSTEDLTELNGTGAAAQSIGGVDDAYKFTLSGGSALHQCQKGTNSNGGDFSEEVGTLTFDYYLPSGQTMDEVFVGFASGTAQGQTTTDAWTSVSMSITNFGGGTLFFRGKSGGSQTFAADGDVYYLKNIVVTQTTADGAVTTFYDQSGNGNNATNATASEQPLVVSGGTLVEENSKAALDFDGSDDVLTINTSTSSFNYLHNGSDAAVFVIGSLVENNANLGILVNNGRTTSKTGYVLQFEDRSAIGASRRIKSNATKSVSGQSVFSNQTSDNAVPNDTQCLIVDIIDGDNVTASDRSEVHINGGSAIKNNTSTNAPTSADATDDMSLFQIIDGKAQEIILFDSDQSANRGTVTTGGGTGIEGNINTYFDIV